MQVTIYGRKTPNSKAVVLKKLQEVGDKEDEPTNAEKAMAFFAESNYKVALFSDRDIPDIVYFNRRFE